MNFVCVYSLAAFQFVLNDDEFAAWEVFVQACCILSGRVMRRRDIDLSRKLLIDFNERWAALAGEKELKPVFHMSTHIPDCVRDLGAPTAWWGFPLERMVAFVGDTNTNNREIEVSVAHSIPLLCLGGAFRTTNHSLRML